MNFILEAREAALEARIRNLQDQIRLKEAELRLLEELMQDLEPGISWETAGKRLHARCRRPFELSGFYLAQADWAEGLIRFPFFFEAGRPRELEPIPLTAVSGLTGRVIFTQAPRYLDSLEQCQANGMLLTYAERDTGLCTKSWFGVPMAGREPRQACGLMGFHSLLPAAFSEEKRSLMQLLGALGARRLG